MSIKSVSKYFALVVVAAALSSCIATKSYKKPDIQTGKLYDFEQVEMDSTTLAELPWQDLFNDPQLKSLIDEALHNNLRLQDAIQQIRVAEANFYQGKMSLFPSLSAGGNISNNEPSDNNVNFGSSLGDITIPASDSYSVSLRSSWELDIWGKLTSAKKASYAGLLNAEATRRAVQTSLIADVANTYYRLLALDRQLQITRRTVANRRKDVQTVRSLKESGLLTGVSLQQSIANQYAAEVTVPSLKQQITELEHTLSVLLGRAPGAINRTSLDRQQPVDSLSTGLPADLLRNRPDILAAEYNFRSAFELTNNARARFYPSFRLTAEGGFQSLKTSDLFQPGSIFYNLVAGLTQPLFNNGQNKAQLMRTQAQQQQALLNLKNTVLNASSEVSNTLSRFKNTRERLRLDQYQLDALEKAVHDSRELLKYGEANYTEVLTAQQNYLSSQLNYVSDRLQLLTAGVDLYRALGGGWDKKIEGKALEN